MNEATVAGSALRVACPLCGGRSEVAFTARDRNREVTDRLFPYRRCLDCDSFFLADVPQDLDRYYPDQYYELPDADDLDRLAAAESYKLKLIEAASPPGRLVEVGPGVGLFARAASHAGYDVVGIEMDDRCCDYLQSIVGVTAIHSAAPAEVLTELPPSRVVTLWHVLEHLPEPWQVLEAAAASLEPGGVVAVATPNTHALQFRLMRERWAHVDAPRHLFLIPPETLISKAASLGLARIGLTTTDPAGRHWDRFGWEYALRGAPARRPSNRVTFGASLLLSLLFRPWEGRGLNGTAYTAVFAKRLGQR